MQLFSVGEIIENYNESSIKKCERPAKTVLLAAVAAGLFIALAGLSAALASFTVENYSVKRLISGLIFPFGLGIIMLLECQLFTGNCMMAALTFQKRIRVSQLLRNWGMVYIGNFMGALSVAYAVFYLKIYQNESFGLWLVNTALAKCQKPFMQEVVLGILCNILVCTGVLLSMSAKDAVGRLLGAYIPVLLFIISGFEHCVANMFYIPAALFCLRDPILAQEAASMGFAVSMFTWQSFFVQNLLPVTLGNVIGGVFIAEIIWNQKQRVV